MLALAAFFIIPTTGHDSGLSEKGNQPGGSEYVGKGNGETAPQVDGQGDSPVRGDSHQAGGVGEAGPDGQKNKQSPAVSRVIPPYASGVTGATAAPKLKNSRPFEIDPRKSIAEILQSADLSDPATRATVSAYMAEREQIRYQAVLARARQMGIPVRREGPGHNVSILYDIRPEGPLYRKTLNTNAAISTGANLLNIAPYGLNGEGMTVGVWDAARARTNHVELAGKVTVGDSTTANDDHHRLPIERKAEA